MHLGRQNTAVKRLIGLGRGQGFIIFGRDRMGFMWRSLLEITPYSKREFISCQIDVDDGNET